MMMMMMTKTMMMMMMTMMMMIMMMMMMVVRRCVQKRCMRARSEAMPEDAFRSEALTPHGTSPGLFETITSMMSMLFPAGFHCEVKRRSCLHPLL